MPLGTEVGLGLRDIVLNGDPLNTKSLKLEGCDASRGITALQFSVNIRCGQTAGWTKIPLGMQVGLGPGDFVFDGYPATPRKKAHPPHPIFGPCLLWPNG